MVLWKDKTDAFFISQTVVLSIKLATVNLIPYFGVSSVIMLSHGYLLQVVQDELTLNPRMEAVNCKVKLANSNFILVVV